jgi:Ca2+-binding EF-hand superfamily protein
MHALFLELQFPIRVKFAQFLRVLKQDETPLLRQAFEGISGSLTSPMDIRIFLMMLMNSITNALNKEERLKFCFNLIDQEENRMITFEDLLLILQANYFAGSPDEVYGKGIMLIKETSQSKSPDDPITWDDYQMLSRKFQNLFYPSTL